MVSKATFKLANSEKNQAQFHSSATARILDHLRTPKPVAEPTRGKRLTIVCEGKHHENHSSGVVPSRCNRIRTDHLEKLWTESEENLSDRKCCPLRGARLPRLRSKSQTRSPGQYRRPRLCLVWCQERQILSTREKSKRKLISIILPATLYSGQHMLLPPPDLSLRGTSLPQQPLRRPKT